MAAVSLDACPIERGDAAALARARAFARENILSRALLHASLEASTLAERSRHWWVVRGEHVLGLAAEIDGFFPYRSVPIAALFPGAGAALVTRPQRPFHALAPELLWPELERAGGRRSRLHLQMVRFTRAPLPEPHREVKRVDDHDELAAFLGGRLSDAGLKLGPFFGVRDGAGRLIAAGGAEFVTERLAQLAYVRTRETRQRQGLARAIVVELIRELETPERRVLLQVRGDHIAAIELYSALGFRGSRRLGKFEFS